MSSPTPDLFCKSRLFKVTTPFSTFNPLPFSWLFTILQSLIWILFPSKMFTALLKLDPMKTFSKVMSSPDIVIRLFLLFKIYKEEDK